MGTRRCHRHAASDDIRTLQADELDAVNGGFGMLQDAVTNALNWRGTEYNGSKGLTAGRVSAYLSRNPISFLAELVKARSYLPLWIRKLSFFFPALISAAIHFGIAPRPAQVSD